MDVVIACRSGSSVGWVISSCSRDDLDSCFALFLISDIGVGFSDRVVLWKRSSMTSRVGTCDAIKDPYEYPPRMRRIFGFSAGRVDPGL